MAWSEEYSGKKKEQRHVEREDETKKLPTFMVNDPVVAEHNQEDSKAFRNIDCFVAHGLLGGVIGQEWDSGTSVITCPRVAQTPKQRL